MDFSAASSASMTATPPASTSGPPLPPPAVTSAAMQLFGPFTSHAGMSHDLQPPQPSAAAAVAAHYTGSFSSQSWVSSGHVTSVHNTDSLVSSSRVSPRFLSGFSASTPLTPTTTAQPAAFSSLPVIPHGLPYSANPM